MGRMALRVARVGELVAVQGEREGKEEDNQAVDKTTLNR